MHISHVNDATVIIWSTFVVRFKGCPNLSVPIQGALPYVSSLSSFFAFPFLWSSTCRRDPAHGFSSSTSVEENNYKERWNPLPTLNWAVFVGLLQAARPSTTKNKAIVRSFYFLFTTIIFLPCLTDETEEANHVWKMRRGTQPRNHVWTRNARTCHRHSQTQGERHAWDLRPLQPELDYV